MNFYRHFTTDIKYFLGGQYPLKDVHRPSPGPSTALRSAQDGKKRSIFADRHRKVNMSEHLINIVFIYLGFLGIKMGRGEHRGLANFTK